MKRAYIVALVALATICLAGQAFALSVSLDAPLQYTFSETVLNSQKNLKPKEREVTGTSGFILGASAGWLGLGYESYEVKPTLEFIPGTGPVGVGSVDATLHFQLYDVFLDLPLPLVHAVVGYGQGRVSTEFEPIFGKTYHVDGADVSQYFVRLGIPIALLFDLHLGYHNVTAQDAKVPKGGSGADKFKLSGSLLTAGVRVGW